MANRARWASKRASPSEAVVDTELDTLDAVATAECVRRGEVSAHEVAQAALRRLHGTNPLLNAVVEVRDEHLILADAGRVDPRGLLAGVPLLWKHSAEFPGMGHGMGSRVRVGVKGRQTDPLLAGLQAEGAVCLGSTNMAEFGLLDVTEPLAHGPTLNPWACDLTAGGSSGGSAAAVAARMVPLAQGSDGGGSIRYPAACCGVFGLKPTRGRTGAASASYDARMPGTVTNHVLTLSVRDSALAFAVAEAACRGEPEAAARRWVRQPLQRRLRVALVDTPMHGGPLAAEAAEAVAGAARLLESLGHAVERCTWPIDAPGFHAAFMDRWARAVHEELQAMPPSIRTVFEQAAEPWTLGLARRGAGLSPERLQDIVQHCGQATLQMEAFHRDWDVMLGPVAADGPVRLGEHAPDIDFATLFECVAHNVAFTPLQNATGQPAMSVPLHWTAAGLPVGVHFAAGVGQDELLLALALQLEAAQPWAARRPELLQPASGALA